jgi:hypothetical protein
MPQFEDGFFKTQSYALPWTIEQLDKLPPRDESEKDREYRKSFLGSVLASTLKILDKERERTDRELFAGLPPIPKPGPGIEVIGVGGSVFNPYHFLSNKEQHIYDEIVGAPLIVEANPSCPTCGK